MSGSEQVVLPALSGNRSLQRLVSEYYDTLDLLPDGVPQSQPPPRRRATAAAASPSPAENSAGLRVPSAAGSGSSSNGPSRDAAGSDSGPGFGCSRANGSSSVASIGGAHPVSLAAANSAAGLNGGTGVANGGAGVSVDGSAATAAALTPGEGEKAGVSGRKEGKGNGSADTATGSSAEGGGVTVSDR